MRLPLETSVTMNHACNSIFRITAQAAMIPLTLGFAQSALAQEDAAVNPEALQPAETIVTKLDVPAKDQESGRSIEFEARELAYDAGDVITAKGNVILRNKDSSARADEVRWDRKTGIILATGNVRVVDAEGNRLFTESVELTDRFEAGAMADLLLALRQSQWQCTTP